MSAARPLLGARSAQEAVLARIRVTIIAVPCVAVLFGAIALLAHQRLALLSVAGVLGWTRLTDP